MRVKKEGYFRRFRREKRVKGEEIRKGNGEQISISFTTVESKNVSYII